MKSATVKGKRVLRVEDNERGSPLTQWILILEQTNAHEPPVQIRLFVEGSLGDQFSSGQGIGIVVEPVGNEPSRGGDADACRLPRKDELSLEVAGHILQFINDVATGTVQ